MTMNSNPFAMQNWYPRFGNCAFPATFAMLREDAVARLAGTLDDRSPDQLEAIDRLVIEPYREKITIGVRGKAIMNDVTRAEVTPSGLDFVPVVDTGRAIAGVSLAECSPEFRRVIDTVDLVIAKGQGNFESLEADYRRPVFFLFRAKCRTICSYLGGAEVNSLQIIGRNL